VVTLDVRNNGALVLISANQNVAAVQTADGKLQYNNHFKDIGSTRKKLMRLAGTAMAVAGAVSQVSGMTNMMKGTGTMITSKGADAGQLEKGANQYVGGVVANEAGNALYDAASKRYLASQATKDNLDILSEMPEGNGLLMWSKDKGEAHKNHLH
jgi:hypothetical protein